MVSLVSQAAMASGLVEPPAPADRSCAAVRPFRAGRDGSVAVRPGCDAPSRGDVVHADGSGVSRSFAGRRGNVVRSLRGDDAEVFRPAARHDRLRGRRFARARAGVRDLPLDRDRGSTPPPAAGRRSGAEAAGGGPRPASPRLPQARGCRVRVRATTRCSRSARERRSDHDRRLERRGAGVLSLGTDGALGGEVAARAGDRRSVAARDSCTASARGARRARILDDCGCAPGRDRRRPRLVAVPLRAGGRRADGRCPAPLDQP